MLAEPHAHRFLNPASDGAVPPILDLNGYKIANLAILARMRRSSWTTCSAVTPTSRCTAPGMSPPPCTSKWPRPSTRLALEVHAHRLRGHIAAMAAAMDGLDVLVFTGGIGEHQPEVRSEAAAGLRFLGLGIDPAANAAAVPDCDITAARAQVRALVITARGRMRKSPGRSGQRCPDAAAAPGPGRRLGNGKSLPIVSTLRPSSQQLGGSLWNWDAMREIGMKQHGERRIVVGVSGSKASIAALHWAAEQARDRHARLDVVRAWEEAPRAPYAPEGPGSAEAAQAEAGRQLKSIMLTALGPPDAAQATAEVTHGRAARTLVDRSNGADMLVLGAHLPADAVSPPMGPVLRACVSRAPCPVVIVHGG